MYLLEARHFLCIFPVYLNVKLCILLTIESLNWLHYRYLCKSRNKAVQYKYNIRVLNNNKYNIIGVPIQVFSGIW